LTEDFEFAVQAWKRGYRIGPVPAVVREQSPQRFMDFMKQRRRWFAGIARLPQFLPKLLALFWTLGTIALYFTIASVVLGLVIPMGTPRWFGALKDFSFVVFVYLYLLGTFFSCETNTWDRHHVAGY
jgi:cellulose synthase/poly-beta-1,6-N-acetylglucosamine synthase-like glycosyltransferase